MMTAVRQTATVSPEGRLQLDVPELPPGTVAEVIVLLPASPPFPELTVAERLAALDRLRAMTTLTDEQVRQWLEDIRLERLAWRVPGDVGP